MQFLIRKCPNLDCEYSLKPCRKRFYLRKGTFLCKWSGRKIPRYQCRSCKKHFSSSTFKASYRQIKPYLNKKIFELYASGITQRRLAKVLATNRKTVARKFLWLSSWARHTHELELLKAVPEANFQMDEMESFEHTRLKPLSIGIAVSSQSTKIIDLRVGSLNYKGRLASLALQKYGPRMDTSQTAVEAVIKSIGMTASSSPVIITDGKPSYPKLIKKVLPTAKHIAVKIDRVSIAQKLFRKGRRNENDPLFVLNYTCAKIRHDLSRMARKVWVTTKNQQFLQRHLDLYIAYANEYALPR